MNGSSDNDWQGRRYWLIGASEGIGRDLARLMSRAGVELVLSARSRERLESLAAELPAPAEVLPLDVTGPLAPAGAALAGAESGGRPLDGLVYLAGVWTPFKASQWQVGAAERMLQASLVGAVRALDQALPGMLARGSGHIVLVGGLSAYRGLRLMSGNGAAKAGLMSLAETLHAELEPAGVRVQLVNPGFVRTRMSAAYPRPMPGLLEPAAAAREIWEHMGTGRFQKSFPLGMAAAARLGRLVPLWLWERLGL